MIVTRAMSGEAVSTFASDIAKSPGIGSEIPSDRNGFRARSLAHPGAALLALLFLVPGAPLAGAGERGFVPIELTAKPIEMFSNRPPDAPAGALEFRGGLDISSTVADFGSLSGLDFAPDGSTVYAIADTGFWFTARLIEKDGRLAGIEDARLAPILDQKGTAVATKRLGDAESLRLVERDGRLTAYVSFEQVNNLRRFVAAPELPDSRSEIVKLPPFVQGLRRNQGLETVALAPAAGPIGGSIVLISERSIDTAGNCLAFVLSGPRAGVFSVRRTDNFDITDGAFLPDGDLVILERKFTFTEGWAMRLRRIRTADIRPGATVDGEILLQADMIHDQVDNMEGLAVRPGEQGETLLTIVSDDNNSPLQRTLLLQFALPPEADANARPARTVTRSKS